MDHQPWWAGSVGYEVYVSSWADSTGDGLGDLAGITAHLPHLADLGVDLLWLTPFFPSPLADHGYDVSDYRGVDPRFGTMADLEALLARAGELGLRVIADLVVNHSSDQHPWFTASRSSREDAKRDWYTWRDPEPDGSEPNNWAAHFGGPAWTLDEATGQYYLHLFLPEQPDLNWENPQVAQAVDDILDFWFDKGLSGVRIDTAHLFVKHPDLPDNPPASGGKIASLNPDWSALEHVYDVDQDDNLRVHRRWRTVADRHDALLVGETYVLDPQRLARYVPDDGLNIAFFFGAAESGWEPEALAAMLREAVDAVDGRARLGLVLSSHDVPRAVSRFGGGPLGRRRALALHTVLLTLPGLPFLYQGEELGLENGFVPPEQAQDPVARLAPAASRDVARTPMPWAPGPGLGFTTGTPWLPDGGRTEHDTVAVQKGDPGSPLARYRDLVRLRRQTPALHSDGVGWLEHPGLLAYSRGNGAVVVLANLSDSPVRADLPAGYEVALVSSGEKVVDGVVPACAAVVLTRA